MNRIYALPAALAFAVHALIFFVGSGKPPPPQPTTPPAVIPQPPSPPEVVLYLQAVEKVKEELKKIAKPEEGGGGEKKDDILMPPGLPDIPHIGPFDPTRERQECKPNVTGVGDKIPAHLPGWGEGDGSGTGNGVFNPTMLDDIPRTRSRREPVYPAALRSTGVTGTVWVEFLVDENGRVHDVKVIKSTHRGFDDATVTAVAQWRFEPGKRKSLPVKFRMSLPVVFSLSD